MRRRKYEGYLYLDPLYTYICNNQGNLINCISEDNQRHSEPLAFYVCQGEMYQNFLFFCLLFFVCEISEMSSLSCTTTCFLLFVDIGRDIILGVKGD